jgi:hypothetical protein
MRWKEIGWGGEEKVMVQEGSRHRRNKACFL